MPDGDNVSLYNMEDQLNAIYDALVAITALLEDIKTATEQTASVIQNPMPVDQV